MTVNDKISKNIEKFKAFNKIKFDNLQNLMTNTNIKRVFNAIPILFCINDKNVPGYIDSSMVPLGISAEFNPDKDALQLVKPKSGQNLSFNFNKPIVETLAVIGSGGSIAYTKESDFDFWVCIDSNKWTKEELDIFNKKAEAIQKWAISKGNVEVHLFINDINKIKKNIYAEDEDEAFGSTMGATLKDEFYRSSIIIAGKTPFWWVIPAATDQQYAAMYEQISKEQPNHLFVDLGNLYKIDKEDLLCGALFQLIKALGNPFKSILKMGILEKYIFDKQTSLLISQELKIDIHNDILNSLTTDSYAYMYEKIFEYYKHTITDSKLLNILPQNLYLKINPQLSKYTALKDHKNLPYKVQVMYKYTTQWGWNEEFIKDLDKFDSWEYKKVMEFWNQIKKFMLLTYKKISQQMPLLNIQQKISESDFTLLSRQIKSLILSEPDEIDQYVTFKDTPCEALINLDPSDRTALNPEWSILKKDTEYGTQAIKTCKDLITLISWATINNIYNPQVSRLQVESSYYKVNQNLIVEFMNEVYEMFNTKSIRIKNSYYLQPVFNITNVLVINFNLTNATSIQTVHHLYRTSWGQTYLKQYNSESAILNILETIIADGLQLRRPFEDCCSIIVPETGKQLYRDYVRLFKEAYHTVVLSDTKINPRFIANFANNYISILSKKKTIVFSVQDNIVNCLTKLSLNHFPNSKLYFFGEDTNISILQQISKLDKPRTFLIVYEIIGSYMFVYTFDGEGNLFTFIKPNIIRDRYLTSHLQFCRNIIMSISIEEVNHAINKDTGFYSITRSKQGKIEISKNPIEMLTSSAPTLSKEYDIHVTISNYGTQQQMYSLKTIRGESPFVPLNATKATLVNMNFAFKSEIPIISKITFLGTMNEQTAGASKYFSEKHKLELVLAK